MDGTQDSPFSRTLKRPHLSALIFDDFFTFPMQFAAAAAVASLGPIVSPHLRQRQCILLGILYFPSRNRPAFFKLLLLIASVDSTQFNFFSSSNSSSSSAHS